MEPRQTRRFRVWLVRYDNWKPQTWNELPPRCVAVEPADEELMSAAEAAIFIEGYNHTMLVRAEPIWAVPVSVRNEQFEPGAALPPEMIDCEPMLAHPLLSSVVPLHST